MWLLVFLLCYTCNTNTTTTSQHHTIKTWWFPYNITTSHHQDMVVSFFRACSLSLPLACASTLLLSCSLSLLLSSSLRLSHLRIHASIQVAPVFVIVVSPGGVCAYNQLHILIPQRWIRQGRRQGSGRGDGGRDGKEARRVRRGEQEGDEKKGRRDSALDSAGIRGNKLPYISRIKSRSSEWRRAASGGVQQQPQQQDQRDQQPAASPAHGSMGSAKTNRKTRANTRGIGETYRLRHLAAPPCTHRGLRGTPLRRRTHTPSVEGRE